VANHRTAEIGNGEVGLAIHEGLAEGLRRHLPGAVGLIVKGLPLCAFLAFSHFALGVDLLPATLYGATGIGALRLLRGRR
jgi:hypothetical protein